MTKQLYIGVNAEAFCLLDDEDHAWAQKWRWGITWNKSRSKMYATRMTRRRAAGVQIKVYLHKEVLKRSGKKPPSPKHKIGDHQDGNSLNNTRNNLEWATPRQNRRNKYGAAARQRSLPVEQEGADVPF